MKYDEAYEKWAKKYIRDGKLRKKEDIHLDKTINNQRQLTADEIAQIFASDYDDNKNDIADKDDAGIYDLLKEIDKQEEDTYSGVISRKEMDALLSALADDYDRTMPEEEYLYERAYRCGWNDAIDHITDLLKYEFKRR